MRSFHSLFNILALCCALPLAAQVTFTSTTYPAPSGAIQTKTIAADLDRDGNPDLITLDTGNNQVLIRYGTGGGHFGDPQAIPVGVQPFDVQVGDFNGDGNLDLVVSNFGSNSISVLTGYGNRTFSTATIPTAASPGALAVGDFNGDGKLDFAVSIAFSNYVQVQFYNGRGDGTFSTGSALALPAGTANLIAVDLNKDGKLDLINVSEPTTIFLNNGGGAFRNAQTISAPVQYGSYVFGAVGDLNADAAPDLLLTDSSFCGPGCGYIEFLDSYVNDGSGHFTLKQSLPPAGSSVNFGMLADLNYDGKLDIAYDDYHAAGQLGYALGNGDGSFQPARLAGALNGDFPALIVHDLNNDGLPDVVATAPGSLQVDLNTSATPDCSSPNSSTLAVHVCAPASGQTVSSPFNVRAVANAPVDVARIEEWIDGHKVSQQLSNQLRDSLTASPGTHTLTVIPVDIFGHFVKQNLTIHVATNTCSAPSNPGVKICTPAPNSNDTSPVSVTAAAKAESGTSITAMRLYVDNVSKYTVNGATLSTSIALARGSHYLAVVAYERNGHALRSTETITIH